MQSKKCAQIWNRLVLGQAFILFQIERFNKIEASLLHGYRLFVQHAVCKFDADAVPAWLDCDTAGNA